MENDMKNVKNEYDVAVIVCTYNSDYDKLIKTLDSCIRSKGVNMQIVITDDNSERNHFEKIREYFLSEGFSNYVLLDHPKNQGTVLNLYDGVVHANAKYIKGFGQGDFFHDSGSLCRWLNYIKKKNCKWSFAEAVYYTYSDQKRKIISVPAHPQVIQPYAGNPKKCRWNYVVMSDLALGVATLFEKETMLRYLNRIKGKVKYAEDNILRLMMFDGIVGGYYANPVIYYEYGEGISTVGEPKWNQRISDDWNAADQELFSTDPKDIFQRMMQMAYLLRTNRKFGDSALFSAIWNMSEVEKTRKNAPRKTPVY